MNPQQISSLPDKFITNKLTNLKKAENLILADLIAHLAEFDKRKLYRELGYSSLFTYAREKLGYSEGSAYRRIQAARSLNSSPELYEKIKTGKITLCAICEIAKIKEDDKIKEGIIKKNLILASEGKTKNEVQKLTAAFLPAVTFKKDTIRALKVEDKTPLNLSLTSTQDNKNNLEILSASIVENIKQEENCYLNNEITEENMKYSFNFTADKEFINLFKEAKEIIGHLPINLILKRVLKDFVSREKSIKRKVKLKKAKNSRFIPKANKILVRKRDNSQCTFISKDGKRCSERHALQYDHIRPFSMGGDNSVDNLRLLCKAHNLMFGNSLNSYTKSIRYSTLKKEKKSEKNKEV